MCTRVPNEDEAAAREVGKDALDLCNWYVAL